MITQKYEENLIKHGLQIQTVGASKYNFERDTKQDQTQDVSGTTLSNIHKTVTQKYEQNLVKPQSWLRKFAGK